MSPSDSRSRPRQGLDYGDSEEVQKVHAAIQREKQEPRVGLEPLSLWLIGIYALALFLGGAYLGRYSGGFTGDSLDPGGVPTAKKTGGPGGGEFGPGGATKTRPYAGNYGGQADNRQDDQGPEGYEYGGVYKSTDSGETWARVNSINPRPMYFSVVRVDPSDEKHLYVLGVEQHQSHDAGKTFRADFGHDVHADGHALWIDPHNGKHMLIGCDGGRAAACANPS